MRAVRLFFIYFNTFFYHFILVVPLVFCTVFSKHFFYYVMLAKFGLLCLLARHSPLAYPSSSSPSDRCRCINDRTDRRAHQIEIESKLLSADFSIRSFVCDSFARATFLLWCVGDFRLARFNYCSRCYISMTALALNAANCCTVVQTPQFTSVTVITRATVATIHSMPMRTNRALTFCIHMHPTTSNRAMSAPPHATTSQRIE